MSTPTLTASKSSVDVAKAAKYKTLSPAQLAWRRFKRNKLAIVGLIIVVAFGFVGVFAPWIAPHPYDRTSLFQQWSQPGALPQFPLGTDMLGRDILSRLAWGIRTSMVVSTFATAFTVTMGLSLGFLSGYYSGKWDFFLNRLFEIMGSLPGLLFQILLILLIGNGIVQVTLAISILAWPGFARLVRAQILAYKERDFMTASYSLGANTRFVALRHLLPNIMNPLVIAISFAIPTFIAAEAGLSFLGYGINEPLPSLGKMVGDIGQYLSSPRYLYVGIIPTVVLALLVLGFSFFGDGLRDALDPSSDRA